MTRVIQAASGATRLLVLAVVIGVAAWGIASDAQPTEANHTKIILSRSSTSPTAETSLILPKNGAAVDLYIWAVNVHTGNGASAYDVRFEFNPAMGSITFLEFYGPPNYSCSPTNTNTCWIGSTGRSPSCLGAIGPNGGVALGQAYASCNSFLPPPPYGATGTGKLAHIKFKPGNQLMEGVLDLTDSFLVSTPPNPADQVPLISTKPYIYTTVTKCADFDGNGEIDLFTDIFGVAERFGWTSSTPGWEWKYDLDDSGNIDLFVDIFNTAFQFGGHC